MRQLAWQQRASGLAHEAVDAERPTWLREALGPVPESTRGKRAWRQAAGQLEQYRATYQVSDPDRAVGPEPRDLAQRGDWQRARATVERVHHKQRIAERARAPQSTREQPAATSDHPSRRARPTPERAARSGQPGPERAAG